MNFPVTDAALGHGNSQLNMLHVHEIDLREIFECTHLKFTVYGRKQANKQAYTRARAQCSHASVGLAQARPNYARICCKKFKCKLLFVYVIAWFAVVFGINSMSNAEILVRGVAEYNLLHYECYQSQISQQTMLSRINTIAHTLTYVPYSRPSKWSLVATHCY